MSSTDSFIDEVTEEVRRERLYSLLRRYGWIAVVLVLLIVGGAAWFEWRRASDRAAAQAAGDALLDALAIADPAERAAAIGDTGGPIGALLRAGALAEAGDAAGAAAAFDAVAADATVPGIYRDLAALRAVMVRGATLDPATRIAALEPLAQPGATFAGLAQEQIALARLESGEVEAARAALQAIVDDATSPGRLRQRAEAVLTALPPAPAQD